MGGSNKILYSVHYPTKNPFSQKAKKVIFDRITIKDDLYSFRSKQIDLHISSQILWGNKMAIDKLKSAKTNMVVEEELEFYGEMISDYSPKFMEYISKFIDIHPKHKLAILAAHSAVTELGSWIYIGNTKINSVQRWIRDNSKYYSAVIIGVCNPLHKTMKRSAHTLLISPDNLVLNNSIINGLEITWSMQFQGIEINTDIIDWELAYLKKLPKIKSIADLMDYFAFREGDEESEI